MKERKKKKKHIMKRQELAAELWSELWFALVSQKVPTNLSK